jgi:hypothetical protein
LTGFIFLKLVSIKINSFFTKTFSNILIGMNFGVIGFAIFRTHGVTILLLQLILLIFSYIEAKKTNQVSEKKIFYTQNLIFIAIISFFVFYIQFSLLYKDSNFVHLPSFDEVSYMEISYRISTTGNEAYSQLGFFDILNKGVSPYHYFELWLFSFIYYFSGTGMIASSSIIALPLLYFIMFLGFLSLAEQYIKEKYFLFFIGLYLFFLFGNYSSLLSKMKIFENILYLGFNFLVSPKIIVANIYIIVGVLFFQKKYNKLAILSFLMTAVVSITMAPAIIGGIGFFLLIKKDEPYFRKSVVYLLFTVLFFVGFYGIYSIEEDNGLFKYIFLSVPSYFVRIKTFLIYIVYFIITSSPWLLGLFLLHRKAFLIWANDFLILFGFTIFSAFVAWFLFFPFIDSNQFYIIPFTTMLQLFLCLASLFILQNIKKTWYKIIIPIMVLQILNSGINVFLAKTDFTSKANLYSREYLQEVDILTQSIPINSLGGYIVDEKDLGFTATAFPSNTNLGDYLIKTNPSFQPINLSFDVFLKNKNAAIQNYSKSTFFYRYVNNHPELSQLTLAAQQKYFIQNLNLKYLILSRNVIIDNELLDLVKKQVKDSVTGEQFFILK